MPAVVKLINLLTFFVAFFIIDGCTKYVLFPRKMNVALHSFPGKNLDINTFICLRTIRNCF